MTEPVDLDKVRKLCDNATEGPWYPYDRGVGWEITHGEVFDDLWNRRPTLPEGHRTDIGRAGDAEFIAAARELVPAMADELGQLRQTVDATVADLAHAQQEERDRYPLELAEVKACLVETGDKYSQSLSRECTPRCTDIEHERDQLDIAIAEVRAELATKTAVAKSNKRHVEALAMEVERLEAQLAQQAPGWESPAALQQGYNQLHDWKERAQDVIDAAGAWAAQFDLGSWEPTCTEEENALKIAVDTLDAQPVVDALNGGEH